MLDEPASGLDPLARIELRDLIRELAALGTTLVVSSHILTELADFSTSVVIMERGRVTRSGKIDALIAEISNGSPLRIEAIDETCARRAADFLSAHPKITGIKIEGSVIDCNFTGARTELAELPRALVMQTSGVVSFYERRLTLEDVFMATSRHETG